MRRSSWGRTLFAGGWLAIAGCSGGTGSGQDSVTARDVDGVERCTREQGYWRYHANAWPVATLELGTVVYTKDQLLSILAMPVNGNGLVSLAHQLIATKLNIATGASPAVADAAIQSATALIGALVVPPVGNGSLKPAAASSLVDTLNAYNVGETGPAACVSAGTPPTATCGNGVVEPGEQCDDGNEVHEDGCSCTCTIDGPGPGPTNPPPPPNPPIS
jgi:cysteine-rich repeat protein